MRPGRFLVLWGLLVALVCWPFACAPSPNMEKPKAGKCGIREPVEVYVRSNHFYDVVIREASTGRRLGIAYGHHDTRFEYCAQEGDTGVFILDAVSSGEAGYFVGSAMSAVPGSLVVFALGANLRISFVEVASP